MVGAGGDGGVLSAETVRFRCEFLQEILAAGIPVEKITKLRGMAERMAELKLTGVSHLRELIPVLRISEVDALKDRIKDHSVGIIHDGASMDGEAFAIVVRYINKTTFRPATELLALRRYARGGFTGEQIAAELVNVAMSDYGIRAEQILATNRDRASTNGLAHRLLAPFWPSALVGECFAHTTTHVGEHMLHPTLTKFFWLSHWHVVYVHRVQAAVGTHGWHYAAHGVRNAVVEPL